MPFLRLETNVKQDDIPPNFAQELIQVLLQALNVPVSVLMVNILPDQTLLLGDGDEGRLCSLATLRTVGGQGEEENLATAKAISNKISELGISPECQFMSFFDLPPFCAENGPTTLSDLRKQAQK